MENCSYFVRKIGKNDDGGGSPVAEVQELRKDMASHLVGSRGMKSWQSSQNGLWAFLFVPLTVFKPK